MEGELLFPRRKFERKASVSTEIGWKEIIFFLEGRLEGEFLFPERKVGRGVSVSRKEVWKESIW